MYLLIAFVILIMILIVFSELTSKYLLHRLSIVPEENYPEITPEILEKFDSFDPILGWEPRVNTSKKKDTSHTGRGLEKDDEDVPDVVEYSIDQFGSRICTTARNESSYKIATYGDSYCFCREVADTSTYQHYMSEKLGVHVSNYGVGNYGLDQALLRLRRRFDEDPADYLVMTVTASTIARILSIWKHYHELGNVLAVKPRYELTNGELKYIPSPIEEKYELLNLRKHEEYMKENDYHYENWFLKQRLWRPYTLRFLNNINNIPYAFYSTIGFVESRLGFSNPFFSTEQNRLDAKYRVKRKKVVYHERLYDEFEDLYVQLVSEFVEFAEKRDVTPIFLPLQQLRYVKYEQDHGPIDESVIDRVSEECPQLIVCDIRNKLQKEVDDVEELYVDRGEGGHHSPQANRIIAHSLSEIIKSIENGDSLKSTESVKVNTQNKHGETS